MSYLYYSCKSIYLYWNRSQDIRDDIIGIMDDDGMVPMEPGHLITIDLQQMSSVHLLTVAIFTNRDYLTTLRPRQNGRHFADDIFKCIFLNENDWSPVKILLKFVPKGPINNIPALV